MQNPENEFDVEEVKVTYTPRKSSLKITGSQSAFYLFKHIWDKDRISLQEQTYAVFTNRANEVLTWRLLCTGNGISVGLDIQMLIRIALNITATGIIIAHNHPSGNLKFSPADITLTKNVEHACNFFELSFLDHLLLSPSGGYISYVDDYK